MFLKIYIFVISTMVILIFCSPPNFGKFDVLLNDNHICKGPKRKDCTKWDMKIEDKKVLKFNLTVLETIKPLRVKVLVSSNGKELVRLQMTGVCDNLFLKPLFETMFNVTSKCTIPKGYYSHVVNIEEILQQYYGGDFFYGNITFKSVFNNNDCNFVCDIVDVTTTPKKTD